MKKSFVKILVLSLLLFALPLFAFGALADEGDHTHDGVTFAAWEDASSLPAEAGNYYLTADVSLSETWTVPAGETNLDLNGHTVTLSAESGSVIMVSAGKTLSLYDCVGTGMITGGEGVQILGVSDVVKTDLKVVRNGVNGNVKNDVFTDIWHTGNTEPYYLSLDGVRLEFYCNPPKGSFTILHISAFCGQIESVTEPTYYADGTVAEPGSIFLHSPPLGVVNASLYFQTNDFTQADVGDYVFYWGNGSSDGWLQCTKATAVARGTIVTGKLTAQEPGVSVTIDGKTYPYAEKRFTAMPADRYLRTGNLGDTVKILLDDNGFCYAVWK